MRLESPYDKGFKGEIYTNKLYLVTKVCNVSEQFVEHDYLGGQAYCAIHKH